MSRYQSRLFLMAVQLQTSCRDAAAPVNKPYKQRWLGQSWERQVVGSKESARRPETRKKGAGRLFTTSGSLALFFVLRTFVHFFFFLANIGNSGSNTRQGTAASTCSGRGLGLPSTMPQLRAASRTAVPRPCSSRDYFSCPRCWPPKPRVMISAYLISYMLLIRLLPNSGTSTTVHINTAMSTAMNLLFLDSITSM